MFKNNVGKIIKIALIVTLLVLVFTAPSIFFYVLNHSDNNQLRQDILGVSDASPIANFLQTNGSVVTMDLSDDGTILYIGGSFTQITDSENTYTRNRLAAIDLTTLTVTSWDPDSNGYVQTIEVSGSDIFVGGAFSTVGGESRSYIAKLNNTNGDADALWNAGSDDQVHIIKASGSDLFVGGKFFTIGGESRSLIAKLNNTNGDADALWNPGASDWVYSIDISGTSVYIGGSFSSVGSVSRSEFAKIDILSGDVDSECDPNIYTNMPGTVYAIKVYGDYIYLGGDFMKVGGADGVARSKIARLNISDCSLDSAWDPSTNNNEDRVGAIETSGSEVFVTGEFSEIGGESRDDLAVIDSTTGLAGTWNPGLNTENYWDANSSIVVSDSYVIVSGNFTTVGGSERLYLAAFSYTPPATSAPTATSTPITQSTSASSGSTSQTDVIQIPMISVDVKIPNVVKPIKDSNTGGQEIIVVVFPGVFNFNAYLSSNKVEPKSILLQSMTSVGLNESHQELSGTVSNTVFSGGGDRTILGVRNKGNVLWQIGNIQDMWLKGYPPSGSSAAKIIPELQKNNSIIALKYIEGDLVPPGFPNTKFSEQKLKIAHSLDGKNWTLLNSIADPLTNTVATINKVGGYYMIVGGY